MAKNTGFIVFLTLLFCFLVFVGCAGENAEKPNKDSNNTINEPAEPKDDPSEGSADESVGFIEDEIDTAVFYVILTNETSINTERQFTPEDFPEVCLESVEDFLPARLEWVKGLLEAQANDWRGFTNINYWLEYLDNYGRTLKLTLTEKSRENVLEAIELLEEREDVLYAIPEYMPWPNLDEETEKLIIREYVRYMNWPESSLNRSITHYYGTYNGYIAMVINPAGAHDTVSIYIDDYVFSYGRATVIRTWKQGKNSESGRFEIIGSPWDSETIDWRDILTVDHIRSIYQRYLYYRYELRRLL